MNVIKFLALIVCAFGSSIVMAGTYEADCYPQSSTNNLNISMPANETSFIQQFNIAARCPSLTTEKRVRANFILDANNEINLGNGWYVHVSKTSDGNTPINHIFGGYGAYRLWAYGYLTFEWRGQGNPVGLSDSFLLDYDIVMENK